MNHAGRGIWILLIGMAALAGCQRSARQAEISVCPNAVVVDLADGVRLQFVRHGDYLLGLGAAQVDGVELTSPRTVQRPLLAEEYRQDRMIWPLLVFDRVERRGAGAAIHCRLVGFTRPAAYRREFVWASNPDRVREDLPDDLQRLKDASDKAHQLFEAQLVQREKIARLRSELAKAQTQLAGADDAEAENSAQRKVRRAKNRLQRAQAAARTELAAQDARYARALRTIRDFQAAVGKEGLKYGDIHRDHYEFAHLIQPESSCDVDRLKAWIDANGQAGHVGGKLVWVVEPETRNIAGWPWKGWSQHYEFQLPKGRTVNALRQLGTWELGGRAVGNTVAALRYRGLGRIEHPLEDRGDGAVASAFTTTEILPGAAGSGPVVSPAVPDARDTALTDRGWALAHRQAAWIVHLARGAGAPLVDYQFRPRAALASFPVRQGNCKAMTESFPGDRCLSQTDSEWFARTNETSTTPQVYLALVESQDRDLAFHRTRWKEVDQHVRDAVSRQLGFVQPEVLPTAGYLLEVELPTNLKGIAERAEKIAAQNVRKVVIHNPGWVNHRFPDGHAKTGGGGICTIYDWRPTSDNVQPWRQMVEAFHANDILYYPWLTGMVWGDSPFVDRVGREAKHWAINAPGRTTSNGYAGHLNLNIRDPACRRELLEMLETTRRQCGYDGFWADSFQNLFMSTLDWANGTGAPLQRAWWQQVAAWSRDGIGWMAESHSVPGLSCSIEVEAWQEDFWYFPHVVKWYRVHAQDRFTPEQLDRQLFQVMANGGWTAPDLVPPVEAPWLVKPGRDKQILPDDIIPSFSRFAAEFLAARDRMDRPYVLPGGAGVLWLDAERDDRGVLFVLEPMDCPAGLRAGPVTDGSAPGVRRLTPRCTYAVTGPNLLADFNIPRPPQRDPRTEPSRAGPGLLRGVARQRLEDKGRASADQNAAPNPSHHSGK